MRFTVSSRLHVTDKRKIKFFRSFVFLSFRKRLSFFACLFVHKENHRGWIKFLIEFSTEKRGHEKNIGLSKVVFILKCPFIVYFKACTSY